MWAEKHASPGRAVLSMTVTGSMVNGHGISHGGFILTLADSAPASPMCASPAG